MYDSGLDFGSVVGVPLSSFASCNCLELRTIKMETGSSAVIHSFPLLGFHYTFFFLRGIDYRKEIVSKICTCSEGKNV